MTLLHEALPCETLPCVTLLCMALACSVQHERPQALPKECGQQLRHQSQADGGNPERHGHLRRQADQTQKEGGLTGGRHPSRSRVATPRCTATDSIFGKCQTQSLKQVPKVRAAECFHDCMFDKCSSWEKLCIGSHICVRVHSNASHSPVIA